MYFRKEEDWERHATTVTDKTWTGDVVVHGQRLKPHGHWVTQYLLIYLNNEVCQINIQAWEDFLIAHYLKTIIC